MTLRPVLQQANIHLTGNAHIDAAWLWPWTETVEVVRQTFGTALQLMDEYPKYTYTQSAAAYDEWLEQKYPPVFNQIQERVKEGRWEMVGGMWVEPDLNMPDGESQVRQLLIGKGYFQTRSGSMCASAGTPIPLATTGSCRKSTNVPGSTISLPRRWRGTTPTSFRSSSSGGSRRMAAACSPTFRMITAMRLSRST